jgi:hypothetical protein
MCGHVGWGAEVAACKHQQAFEEGSRSEDCPDMYPHPFHSLKVQTRCEECHQKARKMAQTAIKLAGVKFTMATLNKKLDRLKTD